MKTYGGVAVQLLHSWLRHYMERSGQLYAPAALPPGKEPRYPLDKRLGGPQSRFGRCGEQKSLALARNRTPAVQPVVRRYVDS
jgi:hypothetical protein